MIKLLTFIIFVYYLFYFCNCGTLPASQLTEQTLIKTLLNGYEKTIRPANQVSVEITAALQQIVSIDEKQQIMTSTSFISQSWLDDRLSWTPNASNDNINVVMLSVKSLWIPDTMVLNSADANGYLTVSDYSLASVIYTGEVYMILPALSVKTRCNFMVQKFPFDKQMCSINLTSWSQGYNRIVYKENDSVVIDLDNYIEHPLWELNGTDMTVIRAEDRVPFEDTYNDIISIQLYLERKPLFFIMNGIFACLILNCVTLLAYTLPFGSQIGLCMTCFMTYSVYSLSFSNLFPQQSEYIMMITLYFVLSICFTLISMVWFMICNHFTITSEMPKPIYAFCGQLQRVFFCCFPSSKEDGKTDKNKDVIIENGDIKKFDDIRSIQATNTQKMKCISCQNLFTVCLQKRNTKVGNSDKKQDISGEDIESNKANPTETITGVTINETAKPKSNIKTQCRIILDEEKVCFSERLIDIGVKKGNTGKFQCSVPKINGKLI
ncbi:unnamed protein product [Rotaria sordida]|uniref:Uncharacterized protein n=1 Tax=Rotaria sordida TaxID=392033 RepID=A0A815FH65_9BILA|nr:unnamed protein product [Rotaria sordida]CAF3846046.1 unnamed protein product [Rotaria sordida]